MASQAPQYQQRPQQSPLQYSQPTAEQQINGQAKPRSYSLHSQNTHRSSGSKHDFHETHEEKEAKRLHSKADPSLAIFEAEPSMVAAMKSNTAHTPLRAMQHKDPWGNPIADPDKSNPTRSRWERPLDTIRSFEAAIDGGYQRKSLHRADTDSVANWNRRSTYNPLNQPRFPQDSYYTNRPGSYRGDSQLTVPISAPAKISYHDAQNAGPSSYDRGFGSRRVSRDRAQRKTPDPHYQVYGREQGVYPMPHKDRSYETVTSAAPSGHSDLPGYQTDPTSSDNSSIDRISPAKRREPVNDYGIGFSQTQGYEAPNFTLGSPVQSHPLPPPPATHATFQASPPATVSRKGSLLRRQFAQSNTTSDDAEKRKSWFGRHFSRNG